MDIKYKVPRILTVDLNKNEVDKLRKEGFNVEEGTFGEAYHCEEYSEGKLNGKLPSLLDQDIIVVDLSEDDYKVSNFYDDDKNKINDSNKLIYEVPSNQDYFDGRYAYAFEHKEEFQTLLSEGGVLIIFAEKELIEEYQLVGYTNGCRDSSKNFQLKNYSWLPDGYQIKNCITGSLISLKPKFMDGVSNDNINYRCYFPYIYEENCEFVIKNKLNKVIGFSQKFFKGTIIALPQFKNKSEILITLFKEYLSELRPEFFPDFVNDSWMHKEEYILPEVNKLISEKDKLKEEYEKRINNIELKINKVEKQLSFATNIMSAKGYDSFLVENIKKCLEFIGYKNVIDVDKEIKDGNRQEDLRILDNDRFDIVEVKGHKGNPTEDDCQAVVKYINRQMKEQQRFDVHGILIVNHQRMLPPMDRVNPAFTEAQIEDAIRDGYTLISTWELYKTIRLLQEKLISFEEVDKEIHTPGLFTAIPKSWEHIGKIEKLFKDGTIACFYLGVDEISIGDELIIQDNNEYFKQEVNEMQIEDTNVEKANRGAKLAIKIEKKISKNANIYLRR